jgi:hypothetical protein
MDQFRESLLSGAKRPPGRACRFIVSQIDKSVRMAEVLCEPDDLIGIARLMQVYVCDLETAAALRAAVLHSAKAR